jgi:hypothetical protein
MGRGRKERKAAADENLWSRKSLIISLSLEALRDQSDKQTGLSGEKNSFTVLRIFIVNRSKDLRVQMRPGRGRQKSGENLALETTRIIRVHSKGKYLNWS